MPDRNPTLCILFLGIARPQSQFPHSCVYEGFKYSQDRSTYFLAAEYSRIGRSMVGIYKSLTAHECGIGTVSVQFLFWEYLIKIFSIGS
jgi:hypothetical protein